MTPDDKQIDLLMRRHAHRAQPEIDSDHLDADELNTFAEGALPPAARARYISHLVQCDQCRRQVTQLTISSGAVARVEAALPATPEGGSFWQRLSALFAPRVLRYAAFAAVLLIAGSITFIALRQPKRANDLVASSNQAEQHPSSAVQPSAGSANGVGAETSRSQGSSSPLTTMRGSDQTGKADEDKLAQAAPPPTNMKEAPAAAPMEAKKAGGDTNFAKNEPSYAPPPPGEAGQPTSVAGVAKKQAPRKAEEETDKIATAGRERSQGILSSERDDRSVKDQSVAQQRRAVDEKAKGGPSRNFENQVARNANETRADSVVSNTAAARPKDAEEAQTRSVAGRKFRRQGNAWVDQKFKSSMTLKSVARGSDDFIALDSGVRSIAQQLSGEIIVVWKGKAYLIK